MSAIGKSRVVAIFALALPVFLGAQGGRLQSRRVSASADEEGLYVLEALIEADSPVSARDVSFSWGALEGFELLGSAIRPRTGGMALELRFRPPTGGPWVLPELRLEWKGGLVVLPPMAWAEAGLRAPLPPEAGGGRAEPSELEAVAAWKAGLPAAARRADAVGSLRASASFDAQEAAAGDLVSLRFTLEGRAAFLLAKEPSLTLTGKAVEGLEDAPAPRRFPGWEGRLEAAEGTLAFVWEIRPGAGEIVARFDPYEVWDEESGRTVALSIGELRLAVAEAADAGGAGQASVKGPSWPFAVGAVLLGLAVLVTAAAAGGALFLAGRGRSTFRGK